MRTLQISTGSRGTKCPAHLLLVLLTLFGVGASLTSAPSAHAISAALIRSVDASTARGDYNRIIAFVLRARNECHLQLFVVLQVLRGKSLQVG